MIGAGFCGNTIIIGPGQIFHVSRPAFRCAGTGQQGGQWMFRMFPEIDCLVEMSGETFMGERGIKFILCAGTAVIDIDHILSGIIERRGEIKCRTQRRFQLGRDIADLVLPGSIRQRRKVRIHLILKICKDLVRLCTGKSEIGSGSFGKRGDRLQIFLHPVRQRSFQLFDRTIGETGT